MKAWTWFRAVPLNLKSELILTISDRMKGYLSADLASNTTSDVLSSKGEREEPDIMSIAR